MESPVPDGAIPPERAVGVASPVRRVPMLEVLAWLHRNAPDSPEPDAIVFSSAGPAGPSVLVRFDSDPAGVLAWAKSLSFHRPQNRIDMDLRQVIVESGGTVLGWRVEILHVHTDPSTVGRRIVPDPPAPPAQAAQNTDDDE